MAAVLAGVLVAAGCGSSAPAPKSPNGTHTPRATAVSSLVPSVDPKVAALVPAAVKAKGSVVVSMDATYPPNEFIGPDGHTIIGMDADLGRALGAIMGVNWSLTNASFDTIIPGLQSGKYDVGLSSFGDTLARQKVVNFVTYFQAGESFYVKAGAASHVTGLASLCGRSVAVESGTTEEADAATQSKKCTAGGKPAVHIEVYGNQNEANLAVSSGRADAGFVDSPVAAYIVKQSAGVFALSGQAVNVVPYGIALPKANGMDTPTLAAIKALMADGIYAKILAKWNLTTGAITTPVINGATS